MRRPEVGTSLASDTNSIQPVWPVISIMRQGMRLERPEGVVLSRTCRAWKGGGLSLECCSGKATAEF